MSKIKPLWWYWKYEREKMLRKNASSHKRRAERYDEIRNKVFQLREQGLSIVKISRELGVNKSSVYAWIKHCSEKKLNKLKNKEVTKHENM